MYLKNDTKTSFIAIMYKNKFFYLSSDFATSQLFHNS